MSLSKPSIFPANRFRMYQDAKKIVDVRIGFFIHLGVYTAVNLLLFLLNISNRDGRGFWFIWPLLIWGTFVAVHGAFILLYSYRNIRRWQEKVHGRKLLEMTMGLSVHLVLFLVVNSILITFNLLRLSQRPQFGMWSIWIVLGWGIGLGFHCLWFYLNKDHKLKRWKRQKALRMMDEWGGLS